MAYIQLVDWALGNKFQWNLDQNTSIFIHKDVFEKVVCKMCVYCVCVRVGVWGWCVCVGGVGCGVGCGVWGGVGWGGGAKYSMNWVNIGSNNGLLPDATKLP